MSKKSASATGSRHAKKAKPATRAFEKKLGNARSPKYLLRLYIAGMTPKSSRAVENVRLICEQHLAGRYDLEVVDLYQHPGLSRGEQIIAVPTLIKRLPLPLRRFIGDMSDIERILVGLDLRSKTQ